MLPVNGTREALFAFTQTVVNRGDDALVVSPNPFYQIYEGAAFLAGAKPHYLPCLDENGFNPDFDAVSPDIWKRCQILFLCSPGNPTGALIPVDTLKKLIALADEYDFVIAADECYSELYFDEQTPPPGLLSACVELGRKDFKRCVVFHSLSKRSNLPGLRSGFVAGDARDPQRPSCCTAPTTAARCRCKPNWPASPRGTTKCTCAPTVPCTARSIDAVLEILSPVMDVQRPDGGFYLWPNVAGDDAAFCRDLFEQEHVTVVLGLNLSRDVDGVNPGAGRVRMALVAPLAECVEAAERIRDFVQRRK